MLEFLIETKNPAFGAREMRKLFWSCVPPMTRYTPLRFIFDIKKGEYNTQDARRVKFSVSYSYIESSVASAATLSYSMGLDNALGAKVREKIAKIPDVRIVE